MAATDAMHERVVRGALAVASEHGWSGATLARIAEAAGTSRMTLHRHGLGREEIFQLLARAYERDFRAALAAAVAEPGHCAGARRGAGSRPSVRSASVISPSCAASTRRRTRGSSTSAASHARGSSDRSSASCGTGCGTARSGACRVQRTATLLVNAADRTYRHLRAAHGWSARALARGHRPARAGDLNPAVSRAGSPRPRPRASAGRVRASARPRRGRRRSPGRPPRASTPGRPAARRRARAAPPAARPGPAPRTRRAAPRGT